jgi:hypothetical protein
MLIVLAEPGLRIMLLQFGGSLLPGIFIAFLKDPDRPFMHIIRLDESIVAGFLPPGEDFSAKFTPA